MKFTFAFTMLCVILILTAKSHNLESPLTLTKTDENITAKKMLGKWIFDKKLNLRLLRKEKLNIETITFSEDDTILEMIPVKYQDFIKPYTVYQAGNMTFKADKKEITFPFILIGYYGQPYIVFFEFGKDGKIDDSESFYVNLVAGIEKENDLLFIGGDFPGEPFMAFKRFDSEK